MKIQRTTRPPWKDPGFKGRIICRRVRTTQSPFRFRIIWVQSNGVPFNTSDPGLVCLVTAPNDIPAFNRFDDFGVAPSGTFSTNPRGIWTIEIMNRNTGVVFRVRRFVMPARGISAFVIIG
jgi:hypothetical protein